MHASRSNDAYSGTISCVVWGTVRADLDRAAIAIARAFGREVFWVEIQMAESITPGEVAVLQELNPAHSVRIAPREIAIDERLGKLAHWAVVSEDVTSPEGMRFVDYLRIPGPLRAFIDRAGPVRGGVSIVVANAERASSHYAGTPGEVTPFLQELKRLGVSIVVTDAGIPRANAADFDVVVRVATDPTRGIPEVYCSRADSQVAHLFSIGTSVPLDDFNASLPTR